MVRIEDTTELGTATLPNEENGMSLRYLRMIEKWIPVGAAHFAEWPVRPSCGHFFGGCHWYGLETIGPAKAFTVAALSPEYDAEATGVSREELLAMVVKGIRYLCFTHDTGPEDCLRPEKGLGRSETWGTKWGERGQGYFRESQCGGTIADIAQICLLLRDRIDEETWMMVARIHEDYAGRFAAMAPRNGIYLDTQMEENAWTSSGLVSCFLFLSGHEDAGAWEASARRWMFSTCSTPQDAKDDGPVGATEARRLAGKIFTTLPDYWAENHGMVHPNYTGAGVRPLMSVGSHLKLWGRDLPPELYWNRRRVYENLKAVTDGAGYAQAVQGMDWHYLRSVGAEAAHAVASVFFGDSDAAALQRIGLRNSELRQEGNGGRLYAEDFALKAHDQQDPMVMREVYIAQTASLYLLHRLFGPGAEPTPSEELEGRLKGVRSYEHAGFVHHRHAHGQTSLSWRNSIMALPLTREGIFTVSPASDSWLGKPAVQDRPDSHRLRRVRVNEYDDGFAALMIMDRCQESLRQELLFASLPDGRVLSFERFVALEDLVLQSLDQGFLRITNERFPELAARNNGTCRGARSLYHPDGELLYEGWIGGEESDDIVSDLGRPAYLNIDDRIGIRFVGSGGAVYHNRHYYKPYRAIADDLTLSRLTGDRPLRAGQPAGSLAALLVPEQRAADTPSSVLSIPTGPEDSAALAVDGFLAAANFVGASRLCAFDLPRSESIEIFAGAVHDVRADGVVCSVPLPGEGACLLEAAFTVEVAGAARLHTAADGGLYATAADGETAKISVLTGGASRREVTVTGGRTEKLA